MKSSNSKIISALAAVLMLLSVFAACGESSGVPSPASTTAAPSGDSVLEETTTEPEVMTDIPSDLNFGGKECRIFNYETGSWNTLLTADEQDGEVLNDAIYLRTMKVEDMLGVDLVETRVDGGSSTSSAKKLLAAGEDAYEIYMLVDRDALAIAEEGYIEPLGNLPYIDITREYWSQSINQDISIHNRLYFSYGDFNLTGYEAVGYLLFNKELSESYGLDDHYDLILSGGWTLDKIESNMIPVVLDLNGDGKFDDQDQYGITSHPKQVLPCFWIASGLRSVEKNENDEPVFIMASNDKFAAFWSRIFTMMYSNNVYFNSSGLPDYADNTLFKNGQVLYNVMRSAFMTFYREMDHDFGIIPFPKYDEAQNTYYSRIEGGAVTFTPIIASNKDMAGAVLELMACESMKTEIPAYYEIVLKNKYARDERSIEMLDLIFSNRVYDLGDTFWCNQIRDGVFAGKFASNKSDYESTIAKMQNSVDKALQKAIDLFSAVEG